jgi:hypothetical protein
MSKTHKMVRLMQITSVLFAFFGCLMIFIYTPFYSKLIVATLNAFVPVDVNEVAAQSQKMAALSEQESLEPGSDLWIARQAYLQLMEEQIKEHNSQNLKRYLLFAVWHNQPHLKQFAHSDLLQPHCKYYK